MKLEFNWHSGFREDVRNVDGRTTKGRRTDAGVIGILLSSPISLRLR